jgi:L-lactate dehydrogenase complex protein LldG
VTPALAAIASSGTVLVGASGRNGGLVAALPPHHIVLLRESDIRSSLGETLAVFSQHFSRLGGEAVLITGPSRTADIEMMTVLGVHGPLRLDIVVTSEGF